MLDNLKAQLGNNHSVQSVLNQLTRPSFLHSLTSMHLQEITHIVEGKGSSQLHPKTCTALYSIIVTKGHSSYNTKTAIEFLTKYYRQLLPSTAPQNQAHSTSPDSAKTRRVVANLLIRIPTFSNYKLIIKDISPELVPLSLIRRHRAQIMKQCPNLYKDYLLKQHKYVWHRLVEEDQESYPLSEDLISIKLGLHKLAELNNLSEMHTHFSQMQKLVKFIADRIEDSQKEEVNIQQFCEQLDKILTFTITSSASQVLVPAEILSTRNKQIRLIKSSCTQILRRTLLKFRYCFWRKFPWVSALVRNLSTRTYDEHSILPSYLIGLCQTLLEVFGIGFYDFDKLVKDEDAYCLAVLTSALCYNNYESNNKSEAVLLNYQQAKNRKKNDIHISIYNTTLVDTTYQFYLKTTNQQDRQLLLSKILGFLTIFYSRKRTAAMDFYHSAEILSTLATSKNQINAKNRNMICNIKEKILFKGFQPISDRLQQFCHDTFTNYIIRKSKKNFVIHRSLQVFIEPTRLANQKIQSESSYISRQKEKNQESQFRRTNSFDIQFQGWGNQKYSKNSEQKGDKSEMFYSIKQCSVLDQKLDDKKQRPEEENQFILTPQF